MATTNSITGDALRTKAPNDKFDKGWERIQENRKKHKEDCASLNTWLLTMPPKRAECNCGADNG